MNLELHSLEVTEVNVLEFGCFIVTLLLSSEFNASAKKTWKVMDKLTGGKCMVREHFMQVMDNLSG
jgi:hypothetical protein